MLSCGSNAFGQLGIGQKPPFTAELQVVEVIFFLLYVIESANVNHSLEQLDQCRLFASQSLTAAVVSVAAGLRHSLAVTGKQKPNKKTRLEHWCMFPYANPVSCLLLPDSGCVYQWGRGLWSQAKRTLSPGTVPSYLSSVVPLLVPGDLQYFDHKQVF